MSRVINVEKIFCSLSLAAIVEPHERQGKKHHPLIAIVKRRHGAEIDEIIADDSAAILKILLKAGEGFFPKVEKSLE